MEITVLDGARFKDMLLSGALLLEKNKENVDALNVFPVPDGDTGTNMSLTMSSAVNEIKMADAANLGAVADAAARGSLMGARGNSGVILSQLIRGMAKDLKNMDKISAAVFAQALENGVITAFKAVMKPMEGTILTVAREAAKAAVKTAKKTDNLLYVLEETVTQANQTLNETPELLPVLKQAGVVDAGGKGWVLFLEGMYYGLTRETIPAPEPWANQPPLIPSTPVLDSDLDFTYCTEFFILGTNLEESAIRHKLSELGDSLLVVGDEGAVKVHIHSNHPGEVLENCLKYGPLEKIKIDNMAVQQATNKTRNKSMEPEKTGLATEQITGPGPAQKPYGFLVVSTGSGLEEIFRNLGADQIVSGGQTNNPSTEDLVKAIELIDSDNVYVLPNNGNVILTARQAAKLVDKEVAVVPTKSIPAGIAALVAFQQEKAPEVNLARMEKAAASILSAEVTYAVRDTSIDDQEISKGDIIGIVDDKILAVGKHVEAVTTELITKLVNEDTEIITLYWGYEVEGALVENIIEKVQGQFPEIEFEGHHGGQPLYYFLISAE